MWLHRYITLDPVCRGFHLITHEITDNLKELNTLSTGLLTLLVQHTSASLTLNENSDRTVRDDMEAFFSRYIPSEPYFQHTYEGDDDMPAHIKSSLMGASVQIPVIEGNLALGTWQGIYLGEHRQHGGCRTIVATLYGE